MSTQNILNKYLSKLTRLKRANTAYGLAPHKPVLLLSIVELIEKGIVTNNRVNVNTDLVAAFQENWRLLVTTQNQPDFTQPFFYLQSERVEGQQFWFLQPKPGCQINAHIKSVTRLAEVLEHGYFADDLYILLTNPESRSIIKTVLLDTYFPTTRSQFIQSKANGEGYIHDLASYILNEPEAQYKAIKIETEEDVFVRGGLFRRFVPKVYQSTCSFTGMRLESTFGHTFIDACHIVPFSISHDDKVNNGIALCPNLHRAFDRGIVSIDHDYSILVSRHMLENENHPYGLMQLQGRKMKLPDSPKHYPASENIQWHRENTFKK